MRRHQAHLKSTNFFFYRALVYLNTSASIGYRMLIKPIFVAMVYKTQGVEHELR